MEHALNVPSQLLDDVQAHLGVIIPVIDETMEVRKQRMPCCTGVISLTTSVAQQVPINEFDGKVVYGEKRGAAGACLVRPHVLDAIDVFASFLLDHVARLHPARAAVHASATNAYSRPHTYAHITANILLWKESGN